MKETTKSWISIALIWVLLLILASIRPLALPDEGRYGDIGRWMFLSGDWMTPRLNGIPFLHKPPLIYWLQASLFNLAGVHVWIARLVTAFHALLMLIGVYAGLRYVKGEFLARRGVLILGTSLGFLIGGQFINHDFAVATWITIAIGLFSIALRSEKTNLLLARLGFLACAIGFLSKGLLGILLPLGVIVVWLILTNQSRKLISFPWVSGLLIFISISLPWMAKMQMQFPEFFDYFIVRQHFSRFIGAQFNGQQPWWFYLPVICIFVFPWISFLVWDLVDRFQNRFPVKNASQSRSDPFKVLPWIWLLVVLLFFSIPKSKLMGYILPVIPPVTIIILDSWERLSLQRKSAEFWFWLMCVCSITLSVGANLLAQHNSAKEGSVDVATVLKCMLNKDDHVLVAGDYPYDLAFESNLQQPLIVIQDWAVARKMNNDDWLRIFFEGADFDPVAGQVLQERSALENIPAIGRNWLVTPAEFPKAEQLGSWQIFFKGQKWWLWNSDKNGDSIAKKLSCAAKSPE